MNPNERLAMMLSEMMLLFTGFGPSKEICDEFADKVLQEARQVGATVTLPA